MQSTNIWITHHFLSNLIVVCSIVDSHSCTSITVNSSFTEQSTIQQVNALTHNEMTISNMSVEILVFSCKSYAQKERLLCFSIFCTIRLKKSKSIHVISSQHNFSLSLRPSNVCSLHTIFSYMRFSSKLTNLDDKETE